MTGSAPVVARRARPEGLVFERLAQDWALDSDDLAFVARTRGALSRMRFAIDLCSLRAMLFPGEPFDLGLLSYVSPMTYRHVNFKGMYRFEGF